MVEVRASVALGATKRRAVVSPSTSNTAKKIKILQNCEDAGAGLGDKEGDAPAFQSSYQDINVSAMTEPPTKRARRTDSAAMWDRNEGSASPRPHVPKSSAHDRNERRRSRSRDRERERPDRRRDRSRSRDRLHKDHDRDRDRDYRNGRDGHDRRDRDRRERDRSRSRDRYSSKRGRCSMSVLGKFKLILSDAPVKARERSRSLPRNATNARARSPPRGPKLDRPKNDHDVRQSGTGRKDRRGDKMQIDQPNGLHAGDDDDEDAVLKRVMGFTGFNTTHNKKVPGNDIYGVRKEKKTKYRQYMNRTGGFNRPLSPSRE